MINSLTHTLMMIRPVHFRKNEQTAVNNYYQNASSETSTQEIEMRSLEEFDAMVNTLMGKNIDVIVIDDTKDTDTPDSIFPNNWITFHHNNTIGLYPMFAENRRLERNEQVIAHVQSLGFKIDRRIDLTHWEDSNQFLEGSGSLVFDRSNQIAFAAISERTNALVIADFEEKFDHRVVSFTANQTVNGMRKPIYHTNVMMCMGDAFCIICLDCIDDLIERQKVKSELENFRKEIIELTENQLNQFAGNMLQVKNRDGAKFMVMSKAAESSLTKNQKSLLLKYNEGIISSNLETIEINGGGSARCMIAEVFLKTE